MELKILLFLFLSVSLQAASLDQVKADANTALWGIMALADPAEHDYFTTHGSYYQGLWTHDPVPNDGVALSPQVTWSILTLPDPIPCAAAIDVYDGPNGKGWILRGRFKYGDDYYNIILQGSGNETYRAHGWIKEIPLRIR